MHQPQYCDLISGEYRLPWTYLHGIKDYVDMAAHLESVPGARAVINFAPVLLEQISDYARQINAYLGKGKCRCIRDPLLSALVDPVLPVHSDQRMELVSACLRVNRTRVIDRFPAYRCLAGLAEHIQHQRMGMQYLSDQFLVDLLFWYHLGWLGETVRRSDMRVQRWQEQGGNFSLHDRRELLTLIGELLSGIPARYAALADDGRVELSVTPYAHPIMPLLLDLSSAREAMPDVELPGVASYPDGEERCRWHVAEAIRVFEQYFGRRPSGCWPAEGSISQPTLELLDEYGFLWAASGETVLYNSLHAAGGGDTEFTTEDAVLRGYRLENSALTCFFRDDRLSDKVGFEYSSWHADDAVANLVHDLEQIAMANRGRELVVPVILDGENAWEHYPENGYYFLQALYAKLGNHPLFKLSTFSECLQEGVETAMLPRLISGSWVYGTFSTWVGDRDKNRGWDMLGDARRAFAEAVINGQLDNEQLAVARSQLAVCEGSDWFWWFGDYNPADSVSDFESLFRVHLSNLYCMLGIEPPEYLAHTFAHGSGAPVLGGVMRHGQEMNN
mgnify:CR=1 FL=1